MSLLIAGRLSNFNGFTDLTSPEVVLSGEHGGVFGCDVVALVHSVFSFGRVGPSCCTSRDPSGLLVLPTYDRSDESEYAILYIVLHLFFLGVLSMPIAPFGLSKLSIVFARFYCTLMLGV